MDLAGQKMQIAVCVSGRAGTQGGEPLALCDIILYGISPADALIAAVSRLTGAQLAELAAATRKSIGPGPPAYLGLRSRPFAAVQVASAALESAGKGPMMTAKALLLEDAVQLTPCGAGSPAADCFRSTHSLRSDCQAESGVRDRDSRSLLRLRRAPLGHG